MPTSRSERAYGDWLQATHKRDYFVAGIAMALTGYLASSFHPGKIGLNSSTLELVAILSILGAAYSALKRIEAMVAFLRVQYGRILAEEKSAIPAQGAQLAAAQRLETAGKSQPPRTPPIDAQESERRATAIESESKAWRARGERWHNVRNRLLIFGLLLLIAARALESYRQ